MHTLLEKGACAVLETKTARGQRWRHLHRRDLGVSGLSQRAGKLPHSWNRCPSIPTSSPIFPSSCSPKFPSLFPHTPSSFPPERLLASWSHLWTTLPLFSRGCSSLNFRLERKYQALREIFAGYWGELGRLSQALEKSEILVGRNKQCTSKQERKGKCPEVKDLKGLS